jgi:GTP-binding protein YchF
VGVARVQDARLEKLAAITKSRKCTAATIEYVDVGGLAGGREKDSTYFNQIRNVEALAHVVRLFRDESVPHDPGEINPLRDAENVELELILSDLDVATRRIERLERDLKKAKNLELERELHLLQRAKAALEQEKPLRGMDFSEEECRLLRGFMFLTEKPMLQVLNLGDEDAPDVDRAVEKYSLARLGAGPGTAVVAVCGKLESELAELEDAEAAELMAAYGLKESGLERLIHATYCLLGVISFLTYSEAECRAWTIHRGTTALKAAGVVHSDFERGFIKAEVVHWKDLEELGSIAAAREHGRVRLEGKDYVVADGDVIYFRHGG